jgi:hypothetical protein
MGQLGFVDGHLMFTGMETLYEGMTIASIQNNSVLTTDRWATLCVVCTTKKASGWQSIQDGRACGTNGMAQAQRATSSTRACGWQT